MEGPLIQATPGQMMGPEMREGGSYFNRERVLEHLADMTQHLSEMLKQLFQRMASKEVDPAGFQELATLMAQVFTTAKEVSDILAEGRWSRETSRRMGTVMIQMAEAMEKLEEKLPSLTPAP